MNTRQMVKVRPWGVQPGDAILGMPGSCVERCYFHGMGAVGSDAERQTYCVVLSDGREIPYNGEGWLTVIR